ncbi:hypothetical protein [Paraburkholderia aspalathi]|uniref:Uncharacterized protein n=1 Tax=Paraburkholderia aspalathi TaxID=1324617 RepID=A0A1I7EJA7_9BURK|nr:hypothetical protein [Paraburkholderia aspalathi]SFU23999.1 hypothetical protein SAMN05192563_102469 [Paraburkholderia aspalathi]
MQSGIRFEVNVCGGDFAHVQASFQEWRRQPDFDGRGRWMFEGKSGVRRLDPAVFDNTKAARLALERQCGPQDPYALAAHVSKPGRTLWIVMAAYGA